MNNKMSILVNVEGFIEAVGRGGSLQGGIEVDEFEFTEDIQAYRYIDGKIILEEDKVSQLQVEQRAYEELQELQETLSDTDSIALQHWEEEKLGLEPQHTEKEFQEIIKKRQEARLRLKQLNEVITCSKTY